eukprot:8879330-Heterocapsa_arctica.AAC.1
MLLALVRILRELKTTPRKSLLRSIAAFGMTYVRVIRPAASAACCVPAYPPLLLGPGDGSEEAMEGPAALATALSAADEVALRQDIELNRSEAP